jgi:hypothetical protein
MTEKKMIPVGGGEAHVTDLVGDTLNQMDGAPPKVEVDALAPHALDLIDRFDGNIEFARRTWSAAFDEAERLDHNRMSESDEA